MYCYYYGTIYLNKSNPSNLWSEGSWVKSSTFEAELEKNQCILKTNTKHLVWHAYWVPLYFQVVVPAPLSSVSVTTGRTCILRPVAPLIASPPCTLPPYMAPLTNCAETSRFHQPSKRWSYMSPLQPAHHVSDVMSISQIIYSPNEPNKFEEGVNSVVIDNYFMCEVVF